MHRLIINVGRDCFFDLTDAWRTVTFLLIGNVMLVQLESAPLVQIGKSLP